MSMTGELAEQKMPSGPAPMLPPKRRIAAAFGLKAAGYESHAPFQAGLVRHLVQLLIEHGGNSAGLWLDVGCGTGNFKRECSAARIKARIIGFDISFKALGRFPEESFHPAAGRVQADIEAPPFKEGRFDGAIASSVFQWTRNLFKPLRATAAMLKPRGMLLFSAFVDDSFRELFATRELFDLPIPITCPKSENLIYDLGRAGFNVRYQKVIGEIVYAPDAASHLKEISRMGGTAHTSRPLTRKRLVAFCRAWEKNFSKNEIVPFTYRALIGVCEKAGL